MCEPSKVADDWVIKGCHIHVAGIELQMLTDHHGELFFRPVFSSSPTERVAVALREVREHCLPDPAVRKQWLLKLQMAQTFMLDYTGAWASLANGRMLEFKMMRIAIERWEN